MLTSQFPGSSVPASENLAASAEFLWFSQILAHCAFSVMAHRVATPFFSKWFHFFLPSGAFWICKHMHKKRLQPFDMANLPKGEPPKFTIGCKLLDVFLVKFSCALGGIGSLSFVGSAFHKIWVLFQAQMFVCGDLTFNVIKLWSRIDLQLWFHDLPKTSEIWHSLSTFLHIMPRCQVGPTSATSPSRKGALYFSCTSYFPVLLLLWRGDYVRPLVPSARTSFFLRPFFGHNPSWTVVSSFWVNPLSSPFIDMFSA